MRGKIDQFLPKIKKRLSLRYSTVDLMTSMSQDGAEELAYKHAGKYDIIVSCGGDGTLHQVINGVVKSGENPIIGVLPFGTCNDVAHTLGIKFDLDLALDAILRLNTTKYDIMFDGIDYVTYAIATGYLTKVSFQTNNVTKKRLGRLAYVISGLKSMFKFKSLPISIKLKDETIHDKFVFLMVFNSNYIGGFNLDPSEKMDNGSYKLIAIKRGKGLKCYFDLIKLFLRGVKAVRKSKNVIIRDLSDFVIDNHANECFTVDGEKSNFLRQRFVVNKTVTLIKN